MAVDPVCRMRINEETAEKAIHNGRTFFFFSHPFDALRSHRMIEQYVLNAYFR